MPPKSGLSRGGLSSEVCLTIHVPHRTGAARRWSPIAGWSLVKGSRGRFHCDIIHKALLDQFSQLRAGRKEIDFHQSRAGEFSGWTGRF